MMPQAQQEPRISQIKICGTISLCSLAPKLRHDASIIVPLVVEEDTIEPVHFRTLMITFHEDCDAEEVKQRALQNSLHVKLSRLSQSMDLSGQGRARDFDEPLPVTTTIVASYEAYTKKQFSVNLPSFVRGRESGAPLGRPPSRCVLSDETLHRVGIDIIKLTDCPAVEGGELKLVFERDPCVASVEFDQVVRIIGDSRDLSLGRSTTVGVPQPSSDPDATKRGRNSPNEQPYWRTIAGFEEAYDLAECLPSETVAVIDTGIAFNHPSLRKNIWKNPGEIAGNGVDDDGNGFIDDVYGFNFIDNDGDMSDDNGHGTHCAGIIGGLKDNESGAQGVCGTTTIAGLKFMGANGSGATSDAVKAINYCIQMGIRISNNSWGGPGRTDALETAILKSHKAGHIFVTAAGNAGQNNDRSPSYPASYNSPNIVAVAATDSSDEMASFSNTGARSVHVAAPGVAILSTYPPDGFKHLSGTSMASPIVAGLAALLVSLPFESHLDIKQAIMEGVDKIPATRGRVISGGRINAERSILWLAEKLGLQRRSFRKTTSRGLVHTDRSRGEALKDNEEQG
ncbi:putative subtilase family serine protease [Neospora caninum Liverpool]|uniref:subtilisin n=1 Tax=Neospora caninum (strain Liverpool) TaxID=572307 RepID=F0VHZ4_NEOCL|nr:putative subtilase family serine protease [Neospora caninum Liverpool]CBZ53355.1 putative subtilase family serine protease [Neospora caninum Liverpool]CEL67341.1 TPA: subtilase family serine protease, putative [Neospora caninum Liverpool]|eukprot:XP_003883387.1 putative subtilase family serine protease [Neospora caninum Liverpool]